VNVRPIQPIGRLEGRQHAGRVNADDGAELLCDGAYGQGASAGWRTGQPRGGCQHVEAGNPANARPTATSGLPGLMGFRLDVGVEPEELVGLRRIRSYG
jgi:hypothetical protein